jgi:hypothetical protein
MMAGKRDVQYLVLPDATNPHLLARVRWPDVFQAISAARPDWQDDFGLFDLPYDPNSSAVTIDQAAAIAAEWGAHLPSDEAAPASEPPLMRRMPADWSNLSRAEKRAWSIELMKTGKRAAAAEKGAPDSAIEELRQLVSHDRAIVASESRKRRWRRRETLVLDAEPADVIDLTEARDEALENVEDTS